MKELLKRLGLVFIFAGIIVLAIAEINKMESNQMLIASGGLIVIGLLMYVVLNNVLD